MDESLELAVLLGVLFCSGIVMYSMIGYFFELLKINGDSMYPTLKDGEVYLGLRVFSPRLIQKGKIYAIKIPRELATSRDRVWLIKRLTNHTRNKKFCYFVGDNKDCSYDSRFFGSLEKSCVRYLVLWRIK